MGKRDEQRLVEKLVAQSPVEALYEDVLFGLAGCDVVPLDAPLLAPTQDRHAGQRHENLSE